MVGGVLCCDEELGERFHCVSQRLDADASWDRHARGALENTRGVIAQGLD